MNKLIKKIKKYFENNTYTIEEKYQANLKENDDNDEE